MGFLNTVVPVFQPENFTWEPEWPLKTILVQEIETLQKEKMHHGTGESKAVYLVTEAMKFYSLCIQC